MLVPLSWLRDFTPVDLTPEDLGDLLSDLGLVVEGIERFGEGLEGVVVGHVLDVREHPNADKVRLADIDLGNGEPLQIACGAANLEKGQLVPVATIGTTLPNSMTIERRQLRGEWSNGMICSADELGLAKTRAGGILVLPEGLTLGAPFTEAMNIEPDVVYDLAIETNRPDAMCIAGVARDIAGRLKIPFSIPTPVVKEGGVDVNTLASVNVERPDLCPRFTVRVLDNVTVGPSPELIARRLTLAGMRPVNNVVDASNYVMLELGQPSHPYDLAHVPGSRLGVRTARAGETITTLDSSARELSERDIVITDGNDAVIGVAGVMGGESSEIRESTTTVLNEAAVWDAFAINHTSRKLAVRTDASARFERRVDPAALERAQDRFAELVQMSSPQAVVATGIIDASAPQPPPLQVTLRTARLNKVLGTSLDDTTIRSHLEPLGFTCEPVAPGEQLVTIPTFRPDSDREIDVIEEVARMHGYSNIEHTVPRSPFVGGLDTHQSRRRQLRSWLTGRGFDEAWTATLLSDGDFERAGLSSTEAIDLANPIVAEESKLRTSMLPGMLRAVAFNATRRHTGVKLFDIGRTFLRPLPGDLLPEEREHLAIVLAMPGDDGATAARLWRDLTASLNVEGLSIVNAEVAGLHPTRSAEIRSADGTVIGVLGEIDPAVLREHDIPGRVGWIDVRTVELLGHVDAAPQMQPVSRFPAAEFDLAFVVDDAVAAADIERTVHASAGAALETVELFDVYRGDQVGAGRRSLACRLVVSSLEHTLGDADVAAIRSSVISAVESAHGATLRA
jgi:phenylalanyl-tRNA synthetase beta chain